MFRKLGGEVGMYKNQGGDLIIFLIGFSSFVWYFVQFTSFSAILSNGSKLLKLSLYLSMIMRSKKITYRHCNPYQKLHLNFILLCIYLNTSNFFPVIEEEEQLSNN